jgi:hypothetical protein
LTTPGWLTLRVMYVVKRYILQFEENGNVGEGRNARFFLE